MFLFLNYVLFYEFLRKVDYHSQGELWKNQQYHIALFNPNLSYLSNPLFQFSSLVSALNWRSWTEGPRNRRIRRTNWQAFTMSPLHPPLTRAAYTRCPWTKSCSTSTWSTTNYCPISKSSRSACGQSSIITVRIIRCFLTPVSCKTSYSNDKIMLKYAMSLKFHITKLLPSASCNVKTKPHRDPGIILYEMYSTCYWHFQTISLIENTYNIVQ